MMMRDSNHTGSPFLKEGLFLFFPAAAVLALCSPLLWVTVFGQVQPFAREIAPQHWHAHEMLFGVYGAALAGFLTSAVPEWTDTEPRRGKALALLFGLWLPGRVAGLLGMDYAIPLVAATDAGFLFLLLWYVAKPMIEKRNTKHVSFAVWLALFAFTGLALHWAWWSGDVALSGRLLHLALMIFVVFLSLALSRVTVVVVNQALDPSGETTPYRPHPGRRNMAVGLVVVYGLAAFAFPESQVSSYLALATGAAFLDRLAEWFIGPAVLRGEVLSLGGANAAAGIGFLLIGAAGLGLLPVGTTIGMHVLSVPCLGLALFGVFTIAGLRHSGRDLDLPWHALAAMLLVVVAGFARVVPELPLGLQTGVSHYAVSALFWTGAYAVWLAGFLPLFRSHLQGEDSEAGRECA